MSSQTSSKKIFFLLGSIVVFHVVLDLFFLINDKTPQSWDQSGHLLNALQIYNIIKNGNIVDIFKSTYFYPPLYYFATLPIYLFTKSPPYPLFVNFLFLTILIVSVYKIGTIYFDKMSGLFATLIVASYPWIIIQRRNYLLDFPLTAMVAASMYTLLTTEGFIKRRQTVIAGIVAGLCLLTKEFGAVYLVPFYIFTTVKNLILPNSRKVVLKNICLFIIIAISLSAIWYLTSIQDVLKGFPELERFALLERDPTGLSVLSLRYYFDNFWWQLSPILFFVLLPSIILLIGSPEGKGFAKLILPAIAVIYISFTLIPNKDPRYSLPFTVFFALITSGGLYSLRRFPKIRTLATSSIIVICILQSFSLTFGWPNIASGYYAFSQKPNTDNWRLEEIVQFLDSASTATNSTVVVLPDHPQINSGSIHYYSVINETPLNVIFAGEPADIENVDTVINNSALIIYKTRFETMEHQTPIYDYVKKAYDAFSKKVDNFTKINSFGMPDGSEVIIYKNNHLVYQKSFR